MADENLDFDVNINAKAPNLPAVARDLEVIDRKLQAAGTSVERFDKLWRDANGRLRDARGRFAGVGTGLADVTKHIEASGAAYERVSGRISQATARTTGRMLEVAGALSVASTAIGALSRAYTAIDAAGTYAIGAMGARTSTIRAMTQLTGSRPQAELEFYRGQQFSQRTDFTAEQIEKSQTRLMAQGFRDKELYATLFAASDLAAMMPGNKNETLDRITMALSQVKSKGKLQGEELTQQLAEAGLNTTLVKQQLMQAYGLKSTQDVDKLMSRGGVSADVALPAIQRAILAQLGTTRAGEYATGSSGSVQSLISNREEAVKNVLKSFDADANLPAMDRYKKALSEQGRLFDINSKTGAQLSLIMQDLANTALDGKSAWAEFQTGFIESFSQSYTDTLTKQGRNFAASSIDQLDMLGRSIGRLGSVASMAINSTDGLFGAVAKTLNDEIYAFAETQKATGLTYGRAVFGISPLGRLADAMKAAQQAEYNYFFNKGGEGVDVFAEVARAKREGERARGEFGEFSGAGMGGGPAGKNLFDFGLNLKFKAKAAKAAEKEKSSAEPYRGVFWAYQGAVGDKTWASPNIADVVQNQRETAVAITSSVSAQSAATQAPVTINIIGYEKNKIDLANTIVATLGRQNRQPR